jgi:hypothetical protein
MATAIAAGSLLSAGASAAAGASATAFTLGSTAVTFGNIATGASLLSTAFSGFQQFQASENQAEAAELASQQRARELNFQIEQERTQSAIEETSRQRRLRRVLAAQRAQFGAGAASEESGSFTRIQGDTENISRRQQGDADLVSGLRINQLQGQIGQERRAGQARASSFRSRGKTSLLSTASDVASGARKFGELL